MSRGAPIPRNKENDYSSEQASVRRDFIKAQTGAALDTVGKYAIDPEVTRGNIENFIGVVQMPLGLAGPLRITFMIVAIFVVVYGLWAINPDFV